MKKYVFESLKFFCAAILCVILSAFASPSWGANCNLLDESQILNTNGFSINENGYYNGSFANWLSVRFSFDNAFKENTQYTLSFNGYVSGNAAVFLFNYTDGTQGRCTITATQATDYTCETEPNKTLSNIATTYGSGPNTVYVKNIQLEEGTTATAYTPYNPLCATCDGTMVNYTSATGTGVQNGTPTPTNPIEPTFYTQGNMVLRAVGDYKDTFDATTGKITRRVGVAVLDGTEDWRAHNSIAGWFQLPEPLVYGDIAPALCTHYPYSSSQGGAGVYFSTGRSNPQTNRIIIADDINFPRTGMLAEFKQYLAQQYAAGTPVTVYYPLTTEVVEDWDGGASYCETPIKIATTKYNETKFSPLNTALANAISVVDTVVSNTITQAGKIATLQTQKQTRPADDTCPAYKQCLLVEDENGTPHWYEITDPFRDFVRPIIAKEISPNSTVAVFDAGYTQLEYIESTGTQYIDTGIADWNNTIEFEITLSINAQATGIHTYFGVYDSWNQTGKTLPSITTYTSYRITDSFVSGYLSSEGNNIGIRNGQRGTFALKGNTISWSEGSSVSFDRGNDFVISLSPVLFASKQTSDARISEFSSYKLYKAKFWMNGTLVRNFIPVRNNATGKYGLYDTVSKQFYGNAASSGDDFTAGPIVENDADVPAPQWIRAWDANAQYNLSAGEIYGTAQCNNLSGTEHAQKATSAQMASSGWSENGAKCWCKVVGINVDNEYTEAPATASWVFDAVRPSVEDCNRMCAAACSNRVLGEAAFRKALFGD